MTSRDFAYWLQGYFEISKPTIIKEDQIEVIKNHLNLVFKHEIDPSITTDPQKMSELQEIHDGTIKPNKINRPPLHGGSDEGSLILRC